MTFVVEDFEDQTPGTIPDGWTVQRMDTNETTYVIDTGAIQGDKSFRVGDDSGGSYADVFHPVGDEDVLMAGKMERTVLAGNWHQGQVYVTDSSGTVLYSYLFASDSSSGGWEVRFAEELQDAEGNIGTPNGTVVSSVPSNTVFDFHIRNPNSSLELLLNNDLIHAPGTAYSGAAEYHVQTDDCNFIIDEALEYSPYVFESGHALGLGSSGQDFVYHGDAGTSVPLSDTADSPYVLIRGTGVGSRR